MSYKEDLKKLEKYYQEELKRKDKLIEQLKKENNVILGSALKRSEQLTNTQDKIKGLMKINEKLRQKLDKQ